VFVDSGSAGCEEGTVGEPYDTFTEGVNDVCTGGTVYVTPGTYPEMISINRAMNLNSTGGIVHIEP